MYMERFPRVEDMTPANLNAVASYNEYRDYLKRNTDYEGTFKDWCGNLADYLPTDINLIAKVERLISTKYYDWDEEKKYPYTSVGEQVGYWRKANSIHNWFVENVQDGEDDCGYHREVTPSDLIKLRNTCQKVLDSLNLKKGKVENGYTLKSNGEKIYNYEEGMVATNTELAEELLPSCSGFFFGGTSYDQYYVEDLTETINICNNILNDTDFNTQAVYYVSSW